MEDNSQEAVYERLDKLGLSLARLRSEAIAGRANSGIEAEWLEDEEHYEGIDDANRGELNAWRGKPLGQASLDDAETNTGSTVFFNITRPYCDAASARISDMLLPTDDKGWAIKPTPIPDLVAIAEGAIPREIKAAIAQDPSVLANPERGQQIEEEIVADTKKSIDEAREIAERAEQRIEDWHTECMYNSEMRQVIEDASKVGTGVLKGPIPERRTVVAYVDGAIIQKSEIKPVSRRVDVWNTFPDPGCGSDVHKGGYFWERDEITARELNSLQGGDYIDDQIKKVLEEGPHEASKEFTDDRSDILGLTKRSTKNLFEIWYYHGVVEDEDLHAAGCECPEGEKLDVQLTMINNRVIKAVPNALDTGEFPYDFMVWQRRSQSPYGIGVSRQIRTPQRVVNGAARNLMDNAGLAGGPMWVFDQGLIEPIDGVDEIAPRKGWMASEDSDMDDVSKAFTYITMPMLQEDLQAIIQLGLKMAEDVTGLPMLLQGQQGTAPETLGGTQIVNNNASTVLRRIARLWDDLMTKPHVRRYYRYLLQYGDDSEKGDFVINARGSSALVERDVQNQSIAQLGQLVLNPVFGIDPKKWMEEYLKSQRLDHKGFEYDDEEWQQIVERMAQSTQSKDSSVEVAQLRAQVEQGKIESNERVKAAEMEFKAAESEKEKEFQLLLTSVENEITQMKIGEDSRQNLERIKAMIGQTAMKLRTQVELSGTQAITPAVEPRGRAPDGEAFQK